MLHRQAMLTARAGGVQIADLEKMLTSPDTFTASDAKVKSRHTDSMLPLL
jgi:hypothetical protein